MRARDESEALHLRVRRFIASGGSSETFDALACAIARFQARHVAPIGKLSRARGVDPAALRRHQEIAALPSDAFRLRRVAAHDESEDERCFETSGTTQALRGRHPMRTTASYCASALAWGRARLFPDRERLPLVALAMDEAAAPRSSLSFMLARFAEALGGEGRYFFDGERLDVDGAARALGEAQEPLLVAGTSFAFVHLLDALGERRLALPQQSRVMHTGGFKGRSRSVAPEALREAIAQLFALDAGSVIGEYGMTELSSQLYQDGEIYLAPPWMRVAAADPETLAPLAPGASGLARFVDLANVDSAVAVQTADLVRVDDRGRVELQGRAPGATPRGCSLALEHLLERA
jgi:hypothetical protein